MSAPRSGKPITASGYLRNRLSQVPNGWWIILATVVAWVLTAAAGSLVIRAIELLAG
jgi:hypothetical protein